MYENLVRQLNLGCLNCPYENKECSQNAYCEVMINASNAIETLLSENIELKRGIAFLSKNTLGKLRTELDRLKRERDQAVEDLKINSKCSICKNNPKGKDIRKCKYYYTCGLANQFWEWRGVQEENNG
ncbi:hypothetical protein DWY99_08640 [[Clostridium] leptum]|uniref:Uncharacterized protein n=1 Tax=[Clostridium] leptum TaxID=1535 RepID=A0A412AWG6_9FIRM|nr:hypothetical protein DWY99_08640 [[Clostridium] leptum]